MTTKAAKKSRRRAIGSYYTPEWIARWMADRALSLDDVNSQFGSFTVVDPACGDGGFVLPILDWIASRKNVSSGDSATRLEIVRKHVFGVDADLGAIETLRRRILQWIEPNVDIQSEVASVIAENFRCGDALLGRDWSYSDAAIEQAATMIEPIDWRSAFPDVAKAGGFDVVIGNPPYRRELNAKGDFARIADSALGQRWRTARMDLWHYFVHRGLDLLKPSGRLSFIVNSYWIGSTAAIPMRQRMAQETSMEEIVLLGTTPLFQGVSGRHMIFRLRKLVDQQIACRILDLSNQSATEIQTAFVESARSANLPPSSSCLTLQQGDVWHESRLRFEVQPLRDGCSSSPITVGDLFEVRQGIAENPPFVTKLMAEELGEPTSKGAGVFVLTAREVDELDLSDAERSLLRPYFTISAIDRFKTTSQPTHQVLYLTKETAPSVDEFPRVKHHLERFRFALERRREVMNGKLAWWHLHWPREERLFTSPRVLCVQMGHVPQFVYVERPTFVGFSLNLIVARPGSAVSGWRSLAGLAAILNSPRAKRWFESHAKHRGVNLDISGMVLKRFPLPGKSCPDVELKLDQLSRNWPNDGSSIMSAELVLEELVERAYTQ